MSRAVLGMCVVWALSGALGASEIHVYENGMGDYDTIQDAIDGAADGDTVVVHPGTYVIVQALDFNLRHDPDDPGSPEPKNLVLRSVEGPEDTRIEFTSDLAARTDVTRSGIFVFTHGESDASVVEGFTLSGGRANRWGNSSWQDGCGGAILCVFGSSPSVRRCIIRDNLADRGGAVAYADGACPTFVECVFADNYALSFGGAVHGGLVWEDDPGSARFERCTLYGNRSFGFGGAVHGFGGGDPVLVDCVIAGNLADSGGAVCAQDSTVTLERCTIVDNQASVFGGALCCWVSVDPLDLSSIHCSQCTIAGNAAASGGGIFHYSGFDGYFDDEVETRLDRSIVWDNTGGAFVSSGDTRPTLVASSLEVAKDETLVIEGNLALDPRFEGWKGAVDVWVDGAATPGGTGAELDPLATLASAMTSTVLAELRGVSGRLAYSYALAPDSGCQSAGPDGGRIGAETGTWESRGNDRRRIHLAPGSYSIAGNHLGHHVSLLGSDRCATVVLGTLLGLRSGTEVSNLTVTRGLAGGIRVGRDELPIIRDLDVRGNRSGYGDESVVVRRPFMEGGGIFLYETSPQILACRIEGNEAVSGGGVCCWGGSPEFRNCVIAYNKAAGGEGQGGAAFLLWGSEPSFVNCTIVQNHADSLLREAGVYSFEAAPRFKNCIVLGNTKASIPAQRLEACVTVGELDEIFEAPGQPQFSRYGEARYGIWKAEVPCFIPESSSGDECDETVCPGDEAFELRPGSVAIDRGISTGAPDVDVLGRSRCDDPVEENHDNDPSEYYDIGAYEYHGRMCRLSFAWEIDCTERVVTVEVRLTNPLPVEGFQFGVSHDASVLELIDGPRWEGCPVYDHEPQRFQVAVIDGAGSACGCTVVCALSVMGESKIPPGVEQSVARMQYRLLDPLPPGARTELRLVGTLGDPPVPIEAETSVWAVAPITEDALLEICPEPDDTKFRRGDGNGDGRVDITDAIFLLNYLFTGGEPPGCLEATNADDDGKADLTDAVVILIYLFGGGPEPAPPGPDACGPDPPGSQRSLGCVEYSGC